MRRGFEFHLDPSALMLRKRMIGIDRGPNRFFLGEELFRVKDAAPHEFDHFG